MRHGAPGEKAPLVRATVADTHGDPYADELGPGAPLYNAWAIEDDETSQTWSAATTAAAAAGADSLSSVGDLDSDWDTSKQKRRVPAQQQCTFHTPAGRPSSNELWRFRTRGCQDCWAALFFVGLVVVVLLWGMAQVWQLQLTEHDLAVIAGGAVGYDDPDAPATGNVGAGRGKTLHRMAALRAGAAALFASVEGTAPSFSHVSVAAAVLHAVVWCSVAAATTILVAYGGLLLIAKYARQLIFIQAAFASITSAISAGVALAGGFVPAALVFTVMTFAPLLWLYLIQDRIAFTTTMLCATVSVLRRHRSLFLISLGAVVASWFFVVTAVVCVLPSVLRLYAGTAAGKDVVYPVMVAFAVFWVLEVLQTLVHVTVCGLVATWYFAGEEYMPSFPVRSSFHRAITTSFGSVCLGSLITSIVSFIHMMVRFLRSCDSNNGDNFWMCVMDCILGCVEDLVRYFNSYAFVHVAVYGCSYVDAAKETIALVKQCAFSAIFNDALTQEVIRILTFMNAVLVALVTALVTQNLAAVVLLFIMSVVVSSTFYDPVSSCITTVFVCFAEVPVGLQLSFPDLYDALVDADAGYTQRRDETPAYGTSIA
ncbi:Plasma-membrane choline transporter [Novymonas esmeraldas]|uniref:Choline transporter-like protein n=1 Tax=Novymonas esmeraldas TaxID=1808958 RepID=A0AAW0ER32_9TRYP